MQAVNNAADYGCGGGADATDGVTAAADELLFVGNSVALITTCGNAGANVIKLSLAL